MSKSIPFLTRPEKLDGSMPGDMGFDPMGLSEIQGTLFSHMHDLGVCIQSCFSFCCLTQVTIITTIDTRTHTYTFYHRYSHVMT